MREKGFIGSIGDDLPSLLPVIAALLLFFSTFNLALSSFNEAQTIFDNSEKVIQIANAVRGDNYISKYSDFREGCAKIPVKGLFYKVALVDSAWFKQPENVVVGSERIFELRRFVIDDSYANDISHLDFLCTNEFNSTALTDDQIKDISEKRFENLFGRVFPVAFEDRSTNVASRFVVRPMFLVVAVWK